MPLVWNEPYFQNVWFVFWLHLFCNTSLPPIGPETLLLPISASAPALHDGCSHWEQFPISFVHAGFIASIVCFRLCCQYFSGTLHPLLRKFRQHRRGWLMGSCPSSVTLSSFSAFFPLFYKITDQVSAIKQTFVSCLHVLVFLCPTLSHLRIIKFTFSHSKVL